MGFKIYGENEKLYSNRARDILINLRMNKDLFRRVKSGELLPKVLVSMTTEDLASKKLKSKREENRDYNLKAALLHRDMVPNTSEYKCEKCASRKCIYKQVQVDCGDEPMEIYV